MYTTDIENAVWGATAHREADEREYHPLRWLAGMRVCGLEREPAYSKISYSKVSVWEEILRLPCQTDLEDGRAGGYSMSLEFLVLFFQEKSTEESHEHYPAFKIINMNGRLYDPVIGRFFSPDNYVQLPEFTQGFNRYSYCLNNPLKYKDPDGQSFKDVDDHIEVDDMGRTTITQQPGKDVVSANGKSVELSGNGVFRTAYSEEMINGNPATLLTGLSKSDASKIYALMKDSKAEWGYMQSLSSERTSLFIPGMGSIRIPQIDFTVGTSHDSYSEAAVSSMIYKLPEGSVLRYDHRHPVLHSRDVEGYRYSRDDVNFWNVLIEKNPNASAGIHFQGQYNLYYRNGVKTDKYDNPLYIYKQ